MRFLPQRLLSLTCLASLLYALRYFPLERSWLALILALYGALLCWRPRLWLLLLPALLPALDLAPVTGWFFLDENDLLLLLTAAVCYASPSRLRTGDSDGGDGGGATAAARLPTASQGWLLLLALAWAIGLARGLRPLPAIDANAFTSYLSHYNALRIAKGWCWAALLLMPLRHTAGARLDGLRHYLVPGMLGGLALVELAAIRERALFPGLLNFSSDYRSTAPFSAMHTGGAALDGYLALCFPLLAFWLCGHAGRARAGLALLLLAGGLYAGLSTFSRGLFAAYAVSLLILLAWSGLRALRQRRWPGRRTYSMLAAAGVVVYLLNMVFADSGYRGLAAALILLAAAALLAGQAVHGRQLAICLAAVVGLQTALTLLAGNDALLPAPLKPPYLLFITATLLFGAGAWPALPHRTATPSLALALPGFCGLLLGAPWIAWHWGGAQALPSSIALAVVAALLAWRGAPGQAALSLLPEQAQPRSPSRSPASPDRAPAPALPPAMLAAAIVVLALAIPICNSYYATERFASTDADLRLRLRHWRQTLAMMDNDGASAWLGMGLGTFPATYYWHNLTGEQPASYRYVDLAGNRYLQLAAPDYSAGYGELLRMLQRLPVQPHTPYLLSLDVWNSGAPAVLHVRLCARQLLYPQDCVAAPQAQIGPGDGWRRYRYLLDSGPLGQGAPLWRAPVQLELAVEGAGAVLGVDNISLHNAVTDHELVRNGSFTDGDNYWFFSSDHHHLPWHVKNLPLQLYFDLGWLGLLAYAGLLLSTATQLLRRAWGGERAAAVWLSALAGFHVVGLFDSLIDVPRLALLSLLLTCAAALRPAPSAEAA